MYRDEVRARGDGTLGFSPDEWQAFVAKVQGHGSLLVKRVGGRLRR